MPFTEDGGGEPYLTFGPDGNYYFSDARQNRIFKISPRGDISVFAGIQSYQYGYQDGPASESRFYQPNLLVFDQQGNLYVQESGRMRKVTPTGMVSTFLNYQKHNLNHLSDLILGPNNQLYGVESGNERNRIIQIQLDGKVTPIAGGVSGNQDGPAQQARFYLLKSLAFDKTGNLYVLSNHASNSSNQRLSRLSPDGQVKTMKAICRHSCPSDGNEILQNAGSLQTDKQGRLYLINFADRYSLNKDLSRLWIYEILPDPTQTADIELEPLLHSSLPLSSAETDNAFINGKLDEAQFGNPSLIKIDPLSGDLILAYSSNLLKRISARPIPVLRDMQPRSGKWNDKVVLKGYHFQALQQVSLGGIPLEFQLLSDTHLEVKIPTDLPYFKSTFRLDSAEGTYRSEVPFVLNESLRDMASKNPYRGPLSLMIQDFDAKKFYIFQSPTLSPPSDPYYEKSKQIPFDPAQPNSWPEILPNKPGFQPSETAKATGCQISLNHHGGSRVSCGQIMIEVEEPRAENIQALEKQYKTKLGSAFEQSFLLAPPLNLIDLGQLEKNMRLLNATTEDPRYVIHEATFYNLEAALTHALFVELLLDKRIRSASFNWLFEPDL